MKKTLCVLLTLVFMFVITGCGPEFEDTNGPDDYTLATITDENIINMDLGASGYSMSPGSESEDYMTTNTKFKSDNFSGVAEIFGTNLLGKSDMTFDLSSIQVDGGNFRLMVLLDDKIVHEFNHEDLLQSYELRDVNGYVSVRMAGESAAFKYYIQVW